MKNLKYHAVIVVLAIACSWLAVKYFDKSRQAEKLTTDKEKVTKKIQTEAKEIARAVDKNGMERVIYDVSANVITHAQEAESTGKKDIIDTTADALDIRTKQLNSVIAINAKISAENLQLKQQLDASNRPFYTYNANGLALKFRPPLNPADSNSFAMADFTGKVGLTAAQYWKRKWFLGKDHNHLSITSNSPFFSVDSVQYVGFKQVQRRSIFEVQARAQSIPKLGLYGFGPSARISIGGFEIQGGRLYYPNTNQWLWTVDGSLSLARF